MPSGKLKGFISKWLDDSIEGTRNSLWLLRHSSDKKLAMCGICPKPNQFSITQGYKAVKQHYNTAKHQENLERCQSDPRFKQVTKEGELLGNANIPDGFRAMREQEEVRLTNVEKTLRSQTRFVVSTMYHNSSRYVVDCVADLIPQTFSCQSAKIWDLRHTKSTYMATHGLYPYFHKKIVQAMQNSPFSVNFDESTINGTTQLDINVAHIREEDRLFARKMLTSIPMDEGTSAEEISDKVLGALEEDRIDPKLTMKASTDGCRTMLGVIGGVQTLLREKIPTLPKWGGCPGHDCSNILKSATKSLDPTLVHIYPAVFGALNKHSAHKKRDFERIEEWVGLEIKKVPKFIDVRFRVIERCASWMESQDRALYEYFSEMKSNVLSGTYVASETEMIILEEYLGRYIEVRLNHCFLIEVCKPLIAMIDFFESDAVRIQYRYEKMVVILHDYLSKFLKNAGMGSNSDATGRELLKADYKDRKLHLSNKDIWIGKKAEELMKELGLTRESEEITSWLESVREFYEEAVSKMIKYFSEGIKSTSLRALSILNPKLWKTAPLDHCKKQWRILGEKFSNVIDTQDLPQLMCEVTKFKMKSTDGLDWWEDDVEVDEFFARVHREMDADGCNEYPLLSKLGSALCTIHNSSSAAERDFSNMNNIITERKGSTSQLLLETKATIKSEISLLARKCKKCKLLKSKGQKSDHCHCSQWSPPEELMELMRGGGPAKRYKEDLKEKAKDEQDKLILKELRREEDLQKKKNDMKQEVKKLKKRIRTQKREREEQEKAKALEKQRVDKAKERASQLFDSSGTSGGTKRKKSGKSKLEEKREGQRARLV